jgi:hypothetical protein
MIASAEILNISEGRMKNQIIKILHPELGRCFLNISQGVALIELESEYILLKNYKGILPIPEIVFYATDVKCGYLLTRAI